ncbi:MAG: hypothetical protein Q7T55_13110 [Solirubrobacteraceae bacterium]|nr:hypothetical protein [Solirubrobacteraceae bacterium]
MPTLLATAALGLAATTLGLAAAPAGAATSAEYIGLNQQSLMKDPGIDESRWGSFLEPQRAGGMTIGRYDVNWSLGEPVAPAGGAHTYTWNQGGLGSRQSIDRGILEMARYGMRASPVFTAPPGWVGQGGNRLPADHYGNFAAFIAAFAARYGPGGAFWAEHPEVVALPTYDYEIWNEVNSSHAWNNGVPNAAEYVALLRNVSPAVRAAQPSARILASIGWPDLDAYMGAFYAGGGGPLIDGLGFHPYSPHAVGIFGLITKMRSIMAANGQADLPIEATESGIVAATSGPGAKSAGIGTPSDSARAATQSYAAEALGHSDCNVNQFLVYAVNNISTGADGNMGLFSNANAAPTLTASALLRASRRWNASVAASGPSTGRLAVCNPGRTADAALLPLELSVSRNSSTCVAGKVTFDGNPLESARLVLTTSDTRRQSNEVDAYGDALVCLPPGPPIDTFNVYAELPNQARSAVRVCEVPVKDCATVLRPAPTGDLGAAAPAPGTAVTDQAAVKADGTPISGSDIAKAVKDKTGKVVQVGSSAIINFGCWTVSLIPRQPRKDKRGKRSTASVLLGASCPTAAKKAKLSFTVSLKRKGSKKYLRLKTVKLTNRVPRVIRIHTTLAKGDLLTMTRKEDKKAGVPAMRLDAVLKSPGR